MGVNSYSRNFGIRVLAVSRTLNQINASWVTWEIQLIQSSFTRDFVRIRQRKLSKIRLRYFVFYGFL